MSDIEPTWRNVFLDLRDDLIGVIEAWWWVARDIFLDKVTLPILTAFINFFTQTQIRATSKRMFRELEREKILAVIFNDDEDSDYEDWDDDDF